MASSMTFNFRLIWTIFFLSIQQLSYGQYTNPVLSNDFMLSGPANEVVVDPDGMVYIGGNFIMADSMVVNRIVRYDGVNEIMNLGDGVNDAVLDMAWQSSTNSLIVGGLFSSASGVVGTNGIARWTGAQWQALKKGFHSQARVNAIAINSDNGYIYAGGSFEVDVNGVQTYSNLAYFDGSNWHGFSQQIDNVVYVLEFGLNGILYIGGNFVGSSFVSGAHYIVALNTQNNQFSALPGPSGSIADAGLSGSVQDLCFDDANNRLFIVGYFDQTYDSQAVTVAMWDGT